MRFSSMDFLQFWYAASSYKSAYIRLSEADVRSTEIEQHKEICNAALARDSSLSDDRCCVGVAVASGTPGTADASCHGHSARARFDDLRFEEFAPPR
jgi:hypothetical protein